MRQMVLTPGELETVDALRDQFVTEPEIVMLMTIALLTSRRVGSVALSYLAARDELRQHPAELRP